VSSPHALLAGEGLTVAYGGVHALTAVDLAVTEGEILGLVGANGAGKTTLLECLAGYTRPDAGRVVYHGRDITGLAPDVRACQGIVRSFQDARLFPSMPVWDALMLAHERTAPSGVVSSLLALPRWRAGERRRAAAAQRLAATMGLEAHLDRVVGELSTGVRRVLDLACAMALRPRVLLLDEPSAGLASAEALALSGVLRQVGDATGATIVMVEHDLPLVWGLAGRVAVLEEGRLVACGPPDQLRHHPAVAFGEL
jgi:ABC-type branched-subunit amino acid transport system ATPase component